jgi:hypothetical protein
MQDVVVERVLYLPHRSVMREYFGLPGEVELELHLGEFNPPSTI